MSVNKKNKYYFETLTLFHNQGCDQKFALFFTLKSVNFLMCRFMGVVFTLDFLLCTPNLEYFPGRTHVILLGYDPI
jgi:hypothetical protein